MMTRSSDAEMEAKMFALLTQLAMAGTRIQMQLLHTLPWQHTQGNKIDPIASVT